MKQKTKNNTGWTLTTLLALVFLASAAMKFKGGEAAVQAASMGLSAGTQQLLGIVEITSLLLFIFPRTGIIGTLLLAAYLGGATATHLEHQQPVIITLIMQAVLWITAVIRFPELSRRLANSNATAQDRIATTSGSFA